MKKLFLIPSLAFIMMTAGDAVAHDLHSGNAALREWHVSGKKHHIEGSFYICRDGIVYIEDHDGAILHFPVSALSAVDQEYVSKKMQWIEALNSSRMQVQQVQQHSEAPAKNGFPYDKAAWVLTALLGAVVVVRAVKGEKRYALPLLGLSVVAAIFGFTRNQQHTLLTTTSPYFTDSAFTPFKPNISTFWDSTYFHVESKGIPTTHSMMAGITKWQQQVPIPQCYFGTNSWSIPLNPVLAPTPVPVSPQHFLRGAIAMAVNGIPIFNPYTNTGVDAFLDGQLDNWGGHCGRADDYHYHIAPLHLYGTIPATQPCAFGLDGYAVYGANEPDGSPMAPLDTNNGHFGTNGVYHYHGVNGAPYMIHNMVGHVTEDTTLQIVPQARAYPVRPSLTPLTGATLTGCTPNSASNGYTVYYTLNGQIDSIEYHWNTTGRYTYNFYTAGTGVPVTQNYNGFVQCNFPTGNDSKSFDAASVALYPNPASGAFRISINGNMTKSEIQSVIVYGSNGEKVYHSENCPETVNIQGWPAGIYFVVFRKAEGQIVKRLIVE